MEGIFGALGNFTTDDMLLVSSRLQHRGDHSVTWSPASDVLLGWRGDVPETADRGAPRVPITFAGSILNRAELDSLVKRSAGSHCSRSDAELAWELYKAFGVGAFGRINGQFALALLDPESRKLVLAVDCWASHPLYVANSARGCVFATEYKALLALNDIPAQPNLAAIQTLQATKYLPMKGGLLADTQPVLPGSYVQLDVEGWQVERYCPLRLETLDDRSVEEHAAVLRDALLEATRRLTAGYHKIGIALSAGLDSTLTVGAAREVAPDMEIHTFSVAFQPDDPALKMAAETAQYFATIHHEIVISPEDLPRLLMELVWAIEDPVGREEMVVYMELSRVAAKYVDTVLYGHLADVLFAGMPRHVLVQAASKLKWFKKPIVEFYDYTQFGNKPASALGNLLLRLYFRRGQIYPIRVKGVATSATQKGLTLASKEPLNSLLLSSLEHPTEIGAIERLHSRYGLRYGSIFHDMEVARYAFRIPGRLKIRGRTRKYILRRAAEGILPKRLSRRPKDLIRVARGAQLWGSMDSLADELLSAKAVARRGLFDWDEIVQLRDRPPSGDCPDDRFYHLWTLLLTEIWARTYIDGRGGKPYRLPRCSPPVTVCGTPNRCGSDGDLKFAGHHLGPATK